MFTIKRFLNRISAWFTIGKVGILLLLIALPGIRLWYLEAEGRVVINGIFMQSYIEFVWELVSISFTILIIDRIYQQQDIRREKAHLIRQLRSKDSALAGEASEQLRAQGWLADGTLQGANLHQAILKGVNWAQVDLRNSNLEQATLARANLSEGNLTGTNLQGADLSFANLNGVKTTNQQLQTVFRLAYATMPNGERYNGRFHLPGDLQDAQAAGFNPNDITSMCRFYDISHKQYEL